MASLTKNKSGGYRIQFIGADRKRHTMNLGGLTVKQSRTVLAHVEEILNASRAGHSLPAEMFMGGAA